MTWRFGTITSIVALALTGCAASDVAPEITKTPTYPDQASLYVDLDNPMRPDEFQGATILDVDRYRPYYRLTGCPTEETARGVASPELQEAIEQAQTYSDEASGTGLVVMLNGEVLHESYSQGATNTSIAASASQMKSVLALLYGIAIEQGHIGSIDDPVGDYLEAWSGEKRGAITLRQLLTMSAGLGPADFVQLIFAPDIAEVALQVPYVGAPDKEFVYSNANSKLLAIVLDQQVQKGGYASLAQFLQAELWCPIGAHDAQVWIDPAGKSRGYAGLQARLSDWAKVGEMIRNGGVANGKQIVPSAWIEEMAKPSLANAQYGLHVWLGKEWTAQRQYSAANPIKILHSEPFEAKDIVYFDGFGGQRVYVIPSKGLTVARAGVVNLQFDDSIIPNLLVRAMD